MSISIEDFVRKYAEIEEKVELDFSLRMKHKREDLSFLGISYHNSYFTHFRVYNECIEVHYNISCMGDNDHDYYVISIEDLENVSEEHIVKQLERARRYHAKELEEKAARLKEAEQERAKQAEEKELSEYTRLSKKYGKHHETQV